MTRKALGEFIVKSRDKLGYSVEKLAINCNMNISYIKKIENGEDVAISDYTMEAICRELKISTRKFKKVLEGEVDKPRKEIIISPRIRMTKGLPLVLISMEAFMCIMGGLEVGLFALIPLGLIGFINILVKLIHSRSTIKYASIIKYQPFSDIEDTYWIQYNRKLFQSPLFISLAVIALFGILIPIIYIIIDILYKPSTEVFLYIFVVSSLSAGIAITGIGIMYLKRGLNKVAIIDGRFVHIKISNSKAGLGNISHRRALNELRRTFRAAEGELDDGIIITEYPVDLIYKIKINKSRIKIHYLSECFDENGGLNRICTTRGAVIYINPHNEVLTREVINRIAVDQAIQCYRNSEHCCAD